MKLITLGCSLTQVCGIPEYLGKAINLEVIDLSESAGSNMLQIKRLYRIKVYLEQYNQELE